MGLKAQIQQGVASAYSSLGDLVEDIIVARDTQGDYSIELGGRATTTSTTELKAVFSSEEVTTSNGVVENQTTATIDATTIGGDIVVGDYLSWAGRTYTITSVEESVFTVKLFLARR